MENLNVLLGSITALVIAITGLIAMLFKLWRRDDYTDRRVDLLWKGRLERGAVEAIQKNLVQPANRENIMAVLMRPDVVAAYEPIAPALRELRSKMTGLSKERLGEEVERKFGAWLVQHICSVLGVTEFACLTMALSIAEQNGSNHLEQCSAPELGEGAEGQK